MKERPKFLKVIKGDLPTLLLFIVPFITIFVGIYAFVKGESLNVSMTLVGLTIIFIFIFLLRYKYKVHMIKTGIEIDGTITNVSYLKNKGTVHYNYLYNGQEYNGITKVKTKKDKPFYQKGDKIPLLIDNNDYKNSLMRDIYY